MGKTHCRGLAAAASLRLLCPGALSPSEPGEGTGWPSSSGRSVSRAGDLSRVRLWRPPRRLCAGHSLTGLLVCLQVTCQLPLRRLRPPPPPPGLPPEM